MAYIFLDESGQFKKHNHEDYFVIASFTASDHRRTAKGFRAWGRNHFPRKMRDLSEVKWSATGIPDELLLKVLHRISKLDVQIRFVYLQHKNIPNEYLRGDKVKSGLLYTNIVGELLDMYLPAQDPEFRLFCDRRKLSGMSDSEFRKILEARLLPNLPKNAIIQIEMIDSTTDANIQIADWIAGALSRYLENGRLGEKCFEMLKDRIIGKGKEVFKILPTNL